MDKRIELATAVLAKTLGYYDEGKETYVEVVDGHIVNEYPKPTQTTLQSWLRRNKIGVEVTLNQFSGLYMAGIFKPANTQSGLQKIYGLGGHQPTYEAMLEIGLVEGLKMLKEQEK